METTTSQRNTGPRRPAIRLALPVLLLAAGVGLSAAYAAPATSPAPRSAGAASTAPAPASAGAAGSAARAAEEVPLPQSPVPPFAKADTNQDGKIEWKEAQAAKVSKKLFDHFDFDQNGALSETEWLFVRLDKTRFTPPQATVNAPAAGTHKN